MRKITYIIIIGIITLVARTASAANLSWVPSAGNFGVGNEITVDLKIDSEGVGINAAQATIRFPKETLEVKSIDKSDSAFSFWLEEPSFSNTDGVISFIGGTPYGVSGASVETIRITFVAKGAGDAPLTIADAAVTASDGSGTNVLSKINSASFTILPTKTIAPIIKPPKQIVREAVPAETSPQSPLLRIPLYPHSTEWYNLSNIFTANWDLPRDTLAVSTAINKQPNFTPSDSEGLFDNKTFAALSDGIWYLHIRLKNELGWGTTTHYRIAVDTKTPLPFEITSLENNATDNPSPSFKFKANDALSGIKEYQVKVGASDWVVLKAEDFKGTYTLPLQAPGKHQLTIKAVDRANNSIENSIAIETIPLELPSFTFVTDKIFSGEVKGLTVKGTTLAKTTVFLSLNQKEALIATSEITPDELGKWEYTFSEPLRNGEYAVTIQSKDARGARSLPVISSPVQVSEKPILQLGFITLGKNGAILLLLLILITGFTLGYWFYKERERKIALRVDLTESEASKIFKLIEDDVESLDKTRSTPTPADDEFAIEKLRNNIKKMSGYLKKTITKTKED